jgi:hypothetical protein
MMTVARCDARVAAAGLLRSSAADVTATIVPSAAASAAVTPTAATTLALRLNAVTFRHPSPITAQPGGEFQQRKVISAGWLAQ